TTLLILLCLNSIVLFMRSVRLFVVMGLACGPSEGCGIRPPSIKLTNLTIYLLLILIVFEVPKPNQFVLILFNTVVPLYSHTVGSPETCDCKEGVTVEGDPYTIPGYMQCLYKGLY